METEAKKWLRHFDLEKHVNAGSRICPNIIDAYVTSDKRWLTVVYLQLSGFTKEVNFLLPEE